MSVSFDKINGPWPVRPVPDSQRNGNGNGVTGAKGSFARSLKVASALAAPPAEVSAEVQGAARAAARLHELGRELRFEQGDDGLRVELRDHAGNVLRQVPTTEVFDFAEGKVTT